MTKRTAQVRGTTITVDFEQRDRLVTLRQGSYEFEMTFDEWAALVSDALTLRARAQPTD